MADKDGGTRQLAEMVAASTLANAVMAGVPFRDRDFSDRTIQALHWPHDRVPVAALNSKKSPVFFMSVTNFCGATDGWRDYLTRDVDHF